MSIFNFILLVYLFTAYFLIENEEGALTAGSAVIFKYPNRSTTKVINIVQDGRTLAPTVPPSPERIKVSLHGQTTPAYELLNTPSLDGRAAEPAANKGAAKPEGRKKSKPPAKKLKQKKSGKKDSTTKKPPTLSREMGAMALRKLNISAKNRIIGGKNALPNEFPYHVAFSQDGSTGCGASIIDPFHVLTAAHCTAGYEAQYLTVTAGEHVLSKPEGHEQERNIVEVIDHEEYNPDSMHHDISILKLETPFELNKYVQAVELANPKFVATGSVTITGWGKNEVEDTTGSDRLQKIDLPVADHAQCAANYEEIEPSKPITERQICAGYFDQDGKDACQGDSGGPAIVKEGKKFIQVGVTSFGIGCAIAGFPGIYTSVAKYRDWIDKIVKPEKAGKKDPKTKKPTVKTPPPTKKSTATTTRKTTSAKKSTPPPTKKVEVAKKTGNILKEIPAPSDDKKEDKKASVKNKKEEKVDKKATKKADGPKRTGNILKDIPDPSDDNSGNETTKATINNKKQENKARANNKKKG